MDLVCLFIGLGVGVLVGALLQDRVRRDEVPKAPGDLVSLLKEAANFVNKDEAVGITVTAYRGDAGDDDDDNDCQPPDLPDWCDGKMVENWRNN